MTRILFGTLAVLLLAHTPANATLVYLLPEQQTVGVGEQVDVELWWDFSDEPTLGGGVDLFYDDSLLAFESFEYNLADPALDPALTFFDFVAGGGEVDGIATANFFGIAGPVRIGTATFTSLDLGAAVLSVAESDHPIVGTPFFSIDTLMPYPPGVVEYIGATVNIAAVSEPGSLTLLLAGGLLLLALRRHGGATHL